MKKNDDLFHLIKSLTKSEKRYFKLFAQQAGDEKNYLQLFDAIEEQQQFNEDEIYRRFADRQFTKQLHVVKNYLYSLILKSMRVYNTAKTVEYKLQEAIRDADFLTEKGLYLQAKKILDKADELSSQYEYYSLSLEVLRRLREVVRELDMNDEPNKVRLEILQRERTIQNQMVNINNYRMLSARILHLLNQQGLSRGEEDWRVIDEVFDNELLLDESKAITDVSRCFLYHIRGAYYSAKHEMEKAYESTKKLIEVFEKRPDFIVSDYYGYIYALCNYATDCYNLGHYAELEEVIARISAVAETQSKNQNLSLQIFKAVKSIELTYYTGIADFCKGSRVAKEVEEELKKHEQIIDKNTEIFFCFKLAVLYFYMGNNATALKWVNRVINDKNDYMREDIYCFARIVALFIHFELGNLDLLENMLRSTYSYLAKRNRMYKVETLIMHFIKKLRAIKNEAQLKALFKQMLREAEELDKDPFERNAYSYLDILVWLQHKVDGTPMQQLLPLHN